MLFIEACSFYKIYDYTRFFIIKKLLQYNVNVNKRNYNEDISLIIICSIISLKKI